MIHAEAQPLAGKQVRLRAYGEDHKHVLQVEDWWDRVSGASWQVADGNFAALTYAIRVARYHLPFDDEVVYGKVVGTGAGVLAHVSELDGPVEGEVAA